MLSLITLAVLSQFPVDLPRELGHLRLMSSKATDKGVEIELEYENVTELTFASVGIECTVFDHREVAVNDEYKVLNNDNQGIAPGTRMFTKLVVTDHVSRGRRAECAVTRANKAAVQVASAATEEQVRTPIIRSTPRPAAVVPAPVEEKPAVVAPSAPVSSPSPTVTPAPAAVSAPVKVERAPEVSKPAPVQEPQVCCKKCGGNTKACGDSCIPINQKCRQWAGCACTVE